MPDRALRALESEFKYSVGSGNGQYADCSRNEGQALNQHNGTQFYGTCCNCNR